MAPARPAPSPGGAGEAGGAVASPGLSSAPQTAVAPAEAGGATGPAPFAGFAAAAVAPAALAPPRPALMVMLAASAAGAALAVGVALVVGVAGEALAAARHRGPRHRAWRGAGYLAPMAPTSPLPKEVWARRLSWTAYLATASRNRDIFDEVYRQPSHCAADLAWLRRLPPLRVLAIGEDWCPDVFHTLPTWARLVEELPGWELGIFSRDANPDVMEPFLWHGDRQRIPVYAFYLDDRLQVWWSGRGAAAEKALADFLAGRGFAALPEAERRLASALLHEGYRREFRRQSLEEILTLLRAFFHVAG